MQQAHKTVKATHTHTHQPAVDRGDMTPTIAWLLLPFILAFVAWFGWRRLMARAGYRRVRYER